MAINCGDKMKFSCVPLKGQVSNELATMYTCYLFLDVIDLHYLSGLNRINWQK